MINFDNTTRMLEASLTLRARRQDLLVSNLVNADTPNYRPKDLTFEGVLANVSDEDLRSTSTRALIEDNEDGYVNQTPADSLDGNGVNRDVEIGKAADNLQRFGVGLELVRRKMGLIRYAMSSSDAGG